MGDSVMMLRSVLDPEMPLSERAAIEAAIAEIERLREINRNLHTECARMQMERDRFRACGNNLHAAAMADRPNDIIGSANWRTLLDNALALWEKARRG